MKRCPQCRRDYYDDSLLYCLDDGTSLLEGPLSLSDEPATAVFGKKVRSTGPGAPRDPREEATRVYSAASSGPSVEPVIAAPNGPTKLLPILIGIICVVV